MAAKSNTGDVCASNMRRHLEVAYSPEAIYLTAQTATTHSLSFHTRHLCSCLGFTIRSLTPCSFLWNPGPFPRQNPERNRFVWSELTHTHSLTHTPLGTKTPHKTWAASESQPPDISLIDQRQSRPCAITDLQMLSFLTVEIEAKKRKKKHQPPKIFPSRLTDRLTWLSQHNTLIAQTYIEFYSSSFTHPLIIIHSILLSVPLLLWCILSFLPISCFFTNPSLTQHHRSCHEPYPTPSPSPRGPV